jgi:1-acyl-sn-glycerol-3-phosphate acyltransferase
MRATGYGAGARPSQQPTQAETPAQPAACKERQTSMSKLKEIIGNILGTLVFEALAAVFVALPAAALGASIGVLFGMAGLGALWGAAVGGLYGAGRMFYWYIHGWRLQKIGYLPPEPSKLEKAIYLRLCRGIARIALGPVKIIGSENAFFDGRLVILPNHQHGMDFSTGRIGIPFSFRQIGAAKELKGWRAGPAAMAGGFAVPVMGGKSTDHAASQLVIENTAKLLKQNRRRKLGMFPQGKLVWDNILRPEDFRTGAMRMMRLVWDDTGHEPLAVLPVGIYYWPNCAHPTLFRRFMVWLWSRFFSDYNSQPKYGATIVVGKPIDFGTLPENPREAIEQVRLAIQALLDQAIAAT